MKRHATKEIPHIQWLDNLAFRKMEQLNSTLSKETGGHYLFIEFCQFDVPIVFSDKIYIPPPMLPTQQHGSFADGTETSYLHDSTNPTSIGNNYHSNNYKNLNTGDGNTLYNDFYSIDSPVIRVIDPEQFRENQIERKHRRLNRGTESGLFDKDLKPSAKIRDDINKIISYSPVHELTGEEKDKLWKFRYYITRHKQALTKFLKTISWEDPREVKQAIELLPRWTQIDIDDALELLGPNFHHPVVRAYAVDRLRKASDHELELYLLQLVQALRFEKYEKPVRVLSVQSNNCSSMGSSASTGGGGHNYSTARKKSSLAKFLISRATKNPILGNYFFWYVTVESQEKGAPSIFKHVLNQFQAALKIQQDALENEGTEEQGSTNSNNSGSHHVSNSKNPNNSLLSILERQIAFIDRVLKVATEIKGAKDPRPKKIEKLQMYLSDPKNGLLKFPPIPLPLDPSITIVGCVPEDCTVFKSSLSPLKITLKTISTNILSEAASTSTPGNNLRDVQSSSSSTATVIPTASSSASESSSTLEASHHQLGVYSLHSTLLHRSADRIPEEITHGTYSLMFKTGDDLRQDQLVIQIITLMDQLLRNENLDLKLTPYRILATGPRDGALQFVLNRTLDNVLAEYNGGILGYLKDHNPDPSTPLGVKDDCMDTYVRSCAGYCVITYILGVGDRHLDNLLICPDGHFFHADFGYILGHDPKPFPPMMKLPIQIIDGMGGINSENYGKFRSLCFTAYTTLRKSANLILNLFALMSHSTIPDIMVERDNAAVFKVMEKFCLDMTEEEAILHFQNLINDSVNAFLPIVIDRFHSLAQYWRA